MHSGARSTAALRRTTAFMLPRHFSGIQCQIQLVKTGVLTSCPIYHISADLGSRGGGPTYGEKIYCSEISAVQFLDQRF